MRAWLRFAVATGAGALFALGLGLSGMTQPAKVLGFLDVTGRWDPSLAFVMGGAVLLTLVGFPLVLRRGHPWLDDRFHLPVLVHIDRPLLIGSALFGMGWGLSGYCPGPAISSLAVGGSGVWLFVGAMWLGGVACRRWGGGA